MSVSFGDRVVIDPDVLVRPIGDELVLLSLRTETYFGFDALGTRVWSVLVSAPSLQAAFEILLGEYDVSADALRTDLAEIIDELVRRELVIVESSARQPPGVAGAGNVP
jgi:hypothetical protein